MEANYCGQYHGFNSPREILRVVKPHEFSTHVLDTIHVGAFIANITMEELI